MPSALEILSHNGQSLKYRPLNEPQLLLSVASQHYQCVSTTCIRFINRYEDKGYQLIYKECGMDHVVDDVYSGQADLGVIIISNMTEDMAKYYLNRRDLVFQGITSIKPCAFMSKKHPLAKQRSLKLEDLSDYPYVTFSHNQDMPIDFSEGINALAMQKNKRSITTNDRAAMVNFLCNCNCVSTGSGLLIKDVSDDRMISIPLEDSTEIMVLGIVRPKKNELSREAEKFLMILEEVIQEAKSYTQSIWEKNWLEE